jgi:hypothetical protein
MLPGNGFNRFICLCVNYQEVENFLSEEVVMVLQSTILLVLILVPVEGFSLICLFSSLRKLMMLASDVTVMGGGLASPLTPFVQDVSFAICSVFSYTNP